jgi:predicted phage terminase large subunit-like protein
VADSNYLRSLKASAPKERRRIQLPSDSSQFAIAASAKDQESLQDYRIMLPYQTLWNNDQSSIKVCEKSRRIGLSWCDAADSSLEASKDNGADTYYIGYNKEMAQQYIQDCAEFAKIYNIVASSVEEDREVIDEREIITYRLVFNSGNVVQALSGNPRSIRSKGKPKSRLRIDEMAFHDSADELFKAAMPFKAWGGKVAIFSTHNGINSEFNTIVTDIKQGKKNYNLHSYPFRLAVDQGLYKKICLINGLKWSEESQRQWINEIYADIGANAAEELDCIPSDRNTTKYCDKHWYKIVSNFEAPLCDRYIRFWDLAATQKDLNSKKKVPCNTVGTLLGYSTYTDEWIVLDVASDAFNPANTDRLIINVASQDGAYIPIAHELEGGASGIRDAEHIKNMLSGHIVEAIRPQGDKLLRGKRFLSDSKNGKIKLLKADWNQEWLDELDKIPHGLMDKFDSVVGAYNWIKDSSLLSLGCYFD